MKISGFEGSNLKVLEHLGFRIMELRREAKMSQLDLALRAGMSKNYLCDLEHGRRNPSMLVLVRIAHALQVSFPVLFDGVPVLVDEKDERLDSPFLS